jgi:hypothetical protein
MRFAAFIFLLASLGYSARAQEVAKPSAIMAAELGRVSNNELKRTMQNFWRTQHCDGDPIYIINYGSDREIARREKEIVNSDQRRCFDRSRTTIVRGGAGTGPKTAVWTIPKGANNPEP